MHNHIFSRIGTEAPIAAASFRPAADLALGFALALVIGFVFLLGRFCALGGPSGLQLRFAFAGAL